MPPLTPLIRPDRFFAEQEFHGTRLTAVALLLVFSIPVGIWGAGWVLQERIDGTGTVDNPNRPSESFCEGVPASMDVGCDGPAQIERNIDAVLSEAIGEFMGPAVLGSLVGIVVVGGLLHAGSRMFDGENDAAASFAVALWGLVPTLFSLVIGIALLYVFVDPMTVTPDSDPSVLLDRLQADLQPIEQWGPLVTGITALWSGIIWRFGLLHKQGLTPGEATGVAGSVAVIFWFLLLV